MSTTEEFDWSYKELIDAAHTKLDKAHETGASTDTLTGLAYRLCTLVHRVRKGPLAWEEINAKTCFADGMTAVVELINTAEYTATDGPKLRTGRLI